MHVRSCHSSAQNIPALYHLTQSKRVFCSPISCHSPPCSCLTILEHAQHAFSSGSLPLLSPPCGTQLPARLIPSSPLHLHSPSLTILYKTVDNSQSSFPSSLINFSPSPSADILYILLYLVVWLSLPAMQGPWGHGFVSPVSLSPPSRKFLACSKPSINISWISEWISNERLTEKIMLRQWWNKVLEGVAGKECAEPPRPDKWVYLWKECHQ